MFKRVPPTLAAIFSCRTAEETLSTALGFLLKPSLTTSAKMSSLLIENTSFKTGQTLTLVGVPKPNATQFKVNIGPNKQDIALQINPRFEFQDHRNAVICNSRKGDQWGSEHRVERFPFHRGVEFMIKIEFGTEFVVTLPDDFKIHFPNRIGAEQCSVITVDGDVHITRFKIE